MDRAATRWSCRARAGRGASSVSLRQACGSSCWVRMKPRITAASSGRLRASCPPAPPYSRNGSGTMATSRAGVLDRFGAEVSKHGLRGGQHQSAPIGQRAIADLVEQVGSAKLRQRRRCIPLHQCPAAGDQADRTEGRLEALRALRRSRSGSRAAGSDRKLPAQRQPTKPGIM